jgi:ATP-dependent DNA helicase RecQ
VARLPEPAALPALEGKDFAALCSGFRQRQHEYDGRDAGAESLTRFLCGIATPIFTRLKARNLPGFAALEDYPYAQVRDWVSRQLDL